MNTRVLFIILILLSVSVLAAFFVSSDVYEITNRASTGTDIIAFGDSLVQGVGASNGNDFVSVLGRRVGQTIINLGRGGDTTGAALSRIDDIFRHTPRVVIVLLGGNDSLNKVPDEETFKNLAAIIEFIHNKGSAVILVGVQSGVLRDRYDNEFEALAEKYRTGFVPDILNGIIGDSRYMSDIIHPNDAGYALIAERIEPVLRGLLE